MLELKNISFKRDNKQILDNINLKLEDNKFYAITGPNGSGKSTLAKIIIGIQIPDSGEVIYNNIDITNMKINERANLGIGFAFQQPVVFKGINVYDLLSISSGKKINKLEACDYLSKVGLCAKEYIDRDIDKSLSGGELKRIEIASILARNPKLAIFDEPEAGIDLWSFNNLNKVFKELESESNNTMLVISHQERILDISDKIILMENGKVVKVDTKENMKDSIFCNNCKRGDTNE